MSQANPSEKEIEDYSQAWIANGNKQTPAWKAAYPDSKVADKGAQEKASVMHKMIKVQSRILELSNIAAEKAVKRFGITAESLLVEYEECRKAAMEEGQISAAVSSVTGKVKLCGFDVSKVELTGADGAAIKTESAFTFIPVGSNH